MRYNITIDTDNAAWHDDRMGCLDRVLGQITRHIMRPAVPVEPEVSLLLDSNGNRTGSIEYGSFEQCQECDCADPTTHYLVRAECECSCHG